jgi:hypothetical protein
LHHPLLGGPIQLLEFAQGTGLKANRPGQAVSRPPPAG